MQRHGDDRMVMTFTRPLSALDADEPERAVCYLVRGMLYDASDRSRTLNGALLDKLIRRRLAQIDGVLSGHGGVAVGVSGHHFFAEFDNADAAALGACEMHRRCALIPQIADTPIALKLGIQAVSVVDPDNLRSVRPNGQSELEMSLGQADIVVEGSVVDALLPSLRATCTRVPNLRGATPLYAIDWSEMTRLRAQDRQIPSLLEAIAARRKSQAALCLSRDGQVLTFGPDSKGVTVGRDPANDIRIANPQTSRFHCRIVHQEGRYVLIDDSTNGTYVSTPGKREQLVRNRAMPLEHAGRISFGVPWKNGGPQAFEYQVGGAPAQR